MICYAQITDISDESIYGRLGAVRSEIENEDQHTFHI